MRSRQHRAVAAVFGVLAITGALLAPAIAAPPAYAAAGDIVIEPGELAVTFVARQCSQYTDIMANRARNDIQESLRDLGKDTVYTAGQPISPSIEEPNNPNCVPLRNWDLQMGRGITGKTPATQYLSTVTGPFPTAIRTGGPIAELDSQGVDTGRTIDGAVTIVLSEDEAEQAQQASSLWVQGGIGAQTLPASGEYGFGALRCSVDNLNGDNVEYVSYPEAARHVFCYYFAVRPPPEAGTITVVKELAPGTIGGPMDFRFVGNISYNVDNSFTLRAAPGSPAEIEFVRGEVTGAAPDWTFQEQVPAGWEMSGDPTCTTELGSEWTYDPTDGISVTLLAEDDVVCTFVNERQLTGPSFLYKVALNGTGSFPFEIDVPDPGADLTTTANVTQPNTFVEVASTAGGIPGTYSVTETLPLVGYGTWELREVVCDSGDELASLPVIASGQQRTASGTIPATGTYVCAFVNEFASDGAIAVQKTTIGGVGTFPYSIVPVDDDSIDEQFRLSATTTSPGVAVDASPDGGSPAPENLPIGSVWDVQEFLPAPTAEGFWRVVEADCGPALRDQSIPDAVVRVQITEQNPEVECSFVNEFVTEGTLEVIKRTTGDTALRTDDAVLEWSCDDGTSGDVAVAPGETENTTGVVETSGFLECSVTELQTGTVEYSEVETTATLTINDVESDYTLGDTFLIIPEDEAVVEVDNTVVAILPTTGADSAALWTQAWIGLMMLVAGGLMVVVRRREV